MVKTLGDDAPGSVACQGGRGDDSRHNFGVRCYSLSMEKGAGVLLHGDVITGRLRHDFTRTAVRNMERQGAPRSVAMKLTGHKTENVHRRYAIVSDSDLKAAARSSTVTITVTRVLAW